jgi:hypothetical protein
VGVVCSVFWSSLLILHYVVEKTNRKQLKLHDIPALRSTISTIAVGQSEGTCVCYPAYPPYLQILPNFLIIIADNSREILVIYLLNKTKQNIVYRMMKRVLLAPAIVAILASYTTVVHGFFAVSSGATKILSVGPNNVPLSVVNRVAFSPNRAGNLIRLPMADDDSVSIRRLKCV